MAKEWSITSKIGRDQNGTMYYLLTANNSGNSKMYPCAGTFVSVHVSSATDYTFVFRCNSGETEVHISTLKDINGITPIGNDHAADFASITNAV